MPDGRSLWWYLAVAAVVLGLGARQLLAQDGSGRAAPPAGAREAARTTPAGSATVAAGATRVTSPGRGGGRRLTVHVAGEVRRPGVYRLPAGARVDDAVRRAGGARRGADLTLVNLAAEVEDGRQVIVPARAGAAPAGGGAAAGAAGPAGAAAAVPTLAAKVNLNTATAEQLDGLDGVGPGIAAKILAYRQEHGGFRSVRELGEVPGIGEKRLAALEEQVTV